MLLEYADDLGYDDWVNGRVSDSGVIYITVDYCIGQQRIITDLRSFGDSLRRNGYKVTINPAP